MYFRSAIQLKQTEMRIKISELFPMFYIDKKNKKFRFLKKETDTNCLTLMIPMSPPIPIIENIRNV